MFEFIEAPIFTKIVDCYLSDDEYANLQNYLNEYPTAGNVIKGSGGVRKLRWSTQGRGKRNRVRIIYYFKAREGHIWMLTLYAKNVKETIPSQILKRIKEAIENE